MDDDRNIEGGVDAVDRIGYDPSTDSFHSFHDWSGDDPLSVTVIRTVSAATGRDPASLRPLQEVVETDALESLFAKSPGAGLELNFVYEGYTVTVRENGEVILDVE